MKVNIAESNADFTQEIRLRLRSCRLILVRC